MVSYLKMSFRGHRNIKATHSTTFAFTTEEDITPRGDCFIGVMLRPLINEILPDLLAIIRKDRFKITIECGDVRDHVICHGSERFNPTQGKEIVFRKSKYICHKTVAIMCDKAAADIDRRIIAYLREEKPGTLVFEVV